MKLKKFVYSHCITLSIVWALVIFILCSTPGQYIPSASWLELLSFDKWVHATMFFILGSLLFTISIKKRQQTFSLAVYFFSCVLYGGSLEIMQAKFFSNRSADWYDFIANSFGCLVALLCVKKLRSFYAGS